MSLVHQDTKADSVTSRQLELLIFLSQHNHLSVGEIATALKVSSAAATKAIVRLERKGLVTRSVDVMDRRCVNVGLTSGGRDAVRMLARLP